MSLFEHSLLPYLLGHFIAFFLLCLLAPVTHIVYAYWVWDDSVGQFYVVLNNELQSLALMSTAQAGATLAAWVDAAYEMTYWTNAINSGIANDNTSLWHSLVAAHWDFIQLLTISLQLIALRLAVLLLSAPLLLVSLIVGITNGLLLWYRRRTAGSRDSAFMYHRLKAATYYGIGGFLVIYFYPPVVMDPRWIVPFFAVFVGGMIGVTVGFFKKYL